MTPSNTRRRSAAFALITASLLVPTKSHAQAGAPVGDAVFDSAWYAWQAGAYIDALTILDRILGDPDPHRILEPAAELTGEVFHTTELSTDGRLVRWSPDGQYVSWEAGTGSGRRAHVASLDDGVVVGMTKLDGHSAAFDGAGRVYYISVVDTPELEEARAAVAAALEARNNQEAFRARGRVSQLEADGARLVARDLARGSERMVDLRGIIPQSVFFRRGDPALHLIGAPADAGNTNHVYRVTATGPEPITTADGPKRDAVFLQGERLLYSIDRQSFAIQDLRSGNVTVQRGTQVATSADGSTIAFMRQDEGANVISVIDAGGTARDVVRSDHPVSAPALSRDGRRVAYQAMPREDWELYVAGVDASSAEPRAGAARAGAGSPAAAGEATGSAAAAPLRLTREIQHDLMPQFVDDTRVFAVMGEARHRRSYLYDVETGRRTRLFHNNTVRTVAPEYEWVLSPDGTRVLIVAERDGDTVSPERGVYLMDLTRRVAVDELRARVRDQLAAEVALRKRAEELFSGIASDVSAAVAAVSTDRIFRYAEDLYRFDSKHITQPGNARAIEYLAAKLREFGYEPQLQWFEARGVRTANVIAVLPGTIHPDVLYTVSSHFDSVERGPGADDNTSGTSALLEAARVMASRPQPATIHFAFFTGEEAGLLGSREYVRRAVDNGDLLVGALNNDMVGFANNQRLDNTIRYSNDGIRDIQHGAAILFTDLITYDAKYYKSTDAHAYYDAYGDIVGGIGSYPILGNPHYHQSHDQLETINQQLVAEVSKTTVATLMQLAAAPSRVKSVAVSRSGSGARVTWDALHERDVDAYLVEWGPVGGDVSGSTRVTGTSADVEGLAAEDEVRVSGVNSRGMRSWDAGRGR